MRTRQQKIGDRVEQAALKVCQGWYVNAKLTRGSGNVAHDGDISGVGLLHIDAKGSDKPGKGRSVSKADWTKIKAQARKQARIPVHVGIDDDGELVALVSFEHLVALMYGEQAER